MSCVTQAVKLHVLCYFIEHNEVMKSTVEGNIKGLKCFFISLVVANSLVAVNGTDCVAGN